jgi:hypothetical protein
LPSITPSLAHWEPVGAAVIDARCTALSTDGVLATFSGLTPPRVPTDCHGRIEIGVDGTGGGGSSPIAEQLIAGWIGRRLATRDSTDDNPTHNPAGLAA